MKKKLMGAAPDAISLGIKEGNCVLRRRDRWLLRRSGRYGRLGEILKGLGQASRNAAVGEIPSGEKVDVPA